MIHFVLGGARSGKSSFAQQQVEMLVKDTNDSNSMLKPVYIATASVTDHEMAERINKHQADRCNNWQLIECPLKLTETLAELNEKLGTDHIGGGVYLVDCLTLWLNNHLYKVSCQAIEAQAEYLSKQVSKLVDQLANSNLPIVIVSNEIGLGVIPMGESTRLYVDHCGWLNQKIAQVAQKVTLVTAGIPMVIKDNSKASDNE